MVHLSFPTLVRNAIFGVEQVFGNCLQYVREREVLGSADKPTEQAQNLSEEVQRFLEQFRAA